MASIVKRRNRFNVVYLYTDANGNRKQKWETYKTIEKAKARQKEIEYKEQIGTFVVPQCNTLNELLKEYVALYGKNTWAMSTYSSNLGTINNYIVPFIGDMKLKDITPRVLEKYYQQLLKTKPVKNPITGKAKGEFVGTATIRDVHKLLRNCFGQAVKWELIEKNPALNATVPKHKKQEREIWTADTLFHAIEVCEDPKLKLAINLAFACSLRIGELLGLTWDCVDISEEAINTGYASISINKELQRVTKDALNTLEGKDVFLVFPTKSSRSSTALVLKAPKTEKSSRKIFLPRTVAALLVDWKKEQDFIKEALGSEYQDYNLVMAGPVGFPIESSAIEASFNRLIEENELPKVVFHSLRHSSITYKLKLNGGDIKAVQGDFGHSQTSMVTDVYSHILDDDRRINAQLFEDTFYTGKWKDPDTVSEAQESDSKLDNWRTEINTQTTTVAKEKKAHDLVAGNATFEMNEFDQSAYSAIILGRTVCAGYSRALEMLLNASGIDANVVTSYGHAWNIVRVDGNWYYVDLLWDDDKDKINYRAFNRSAAKLNDYTHETVLWYQEMLPPVTHDSGGKAKAAKPKGTAAVPQVQQTALGKSECRISLEVNDGSTIWYTIDGQAPGSAVSKSTVYTGPFEVNKGAVIRAKAEKYEYLDSEIVTFEAGSEEFSTAIPATGVELDRANLTVEVGRDSSLTAIISPFNATDRDITWTSSNTSVATISPVGVVRGKAAGETVITATTHDGGFTANCTVHVTPVTLKDCIIKKHLRFRMVKLPSRRSA